MVPEVIKNVEGSEERGEGPDMDLKRVRERAKEATTESLLDRVTVYRAGMEESALEVLEQELRSRGVTAEAVTAHAAALERAVLWERPGLAWRCSYCERPAMVWRTRWYRIFFGVVPIFPLQVRCCAEHAE